MKLYSSVYLAMILSVFGLGIVRLAAAENADKPVYIIADGIGNNIEKVAWHPGLTLGEVIALSRFDSDSVYMLLTWDFGMVYTRHALSNNSIRKDVVSPGDILVVGPVDSERAQELDRIPEVGFRLGAKWDEYKGWKHRKIAKQTSPPP